MKQKTPKISIGFLTSLLFTGFIGPNKALSSTVADPDEGKFYPATLLSSEISGSEIFLDEVQKLCSKAAKKKRLFPGLNALTIQNPDNGETYTLLSGFTSMPRLKKHGIDVLKILCGPNSESLRNVLHFKGGNVDYPPGSYIASILPEFTRNLECYFSFLQGALSDRDTYGALEFYKEHASDLTDLFLRFSTVNRKTRLRYFQAEIKKIETNLKDTRSTRLYHLSDFFHTEMLLLYAIANDITVQDFNFGTLKGRPLLCIYSYNEMCPKCEGLFGGYLRCNPQQQFIVSYKNEQTSYKTRNFVEEPPLRNFFKVHVPT